MVGEYATVFPGVKIWPNKKVENNCVLRDNLRDGAGISASFDDAGLAGETGVELTAELCARLGAAVGSAARGEKVAVGCSYDKAAALLNMALEAGLLSTGKVVWDFGSCIETQFDYFVNFTRINAVYICGGRKGVSGL